MTVLTASGVDLPRGLEVPVLVVCGVLGVVVGSFLNVVIWRLPQKMSLSHPASHCPHCDTPIKPYDNVPVVGWMVLRGRCRSCQAPISARYPLVEALTGALFVAVGHEVVQRPALLPAYLFFTAVVVALAFIDFDTKKLPNRLTFPLILVGGPLLALGALLESEPRRLVPALVGGVGLYAFYFLLWFLGRGKWIGFGDVKLAPSLGFFLGFLGWKAWIIGLLGTSAIALVVVLGGLAFGVLGRKMRIPYGPFMVGGAFIGLTLGTPIARLWLGDAA